MINWTHPYYSKHLPISGGPQNSDHLPYSSVTPEHQLATHLVITVAQIPQEDLPVGAGRHEESVRGAPGADVDVGRLLVAGERNPRQ